MMPIQDLRPASVSVFATERDDRPIAIQIESRSSTSSALLTVPEAMALHSMLGQLIRDALPPRERLLAEEREDAARAVAELEHDAWASGAFERALDRHLADLCSAGGEQIHGRGSSRTSEERACPAPGDLSPAESSAEPATTTRASNAPARPVCPEASHGGAGARAWRREQAVLGAVTEELADSNAAAVAPGEYGAPCRSRAGHGSDSKSDAAAFDSQERRCATVAQSEELPVCIRPVGGSTPLGGSMTSSDAFARTVGAAHDPAPALTGGGIGGVGVGHGGACDMVSPRLLRTQSRAADGSESGTPRAGEEG